MFQILFDNKAHSGKVKLSLLNEASIKECRDPNVSGHGETTRTALNLCLWSCWSWNSLSLCPADSYARVTFDVLVAVVCGLSLVLCGRSILRGVILQNVSGEEKVCMTSTFAFLMHLNSRFTCVGRSLCDISVSLWAVRCVGATVWSSSTAGTCCSSPATFSPSSPPSSRSPSRLRSCSYLWGLKVSLRLRSALSWLVLVFVLQNLSSYDVCSILMGTSTLMVWVGVLRYFSFFQKYNVSFTEFLLFIVNYMSHWAMLLICMCPGHISPQNQIHLVIILICLNVYLFLVLFFSMMILTTVIQYFSCYIITFIQISMN